MSTNIKLHKMDLPKKVIIGECWARDGLQNEAKIVSTDEKVEIITRMVESGCTKLEATSHRSHEMNCTDSLREANRG